jgi:cyanoexosortase A
MTDFNLAELLKHPRYILLALLACLLGIYLTIIWQIGDFKHFAVSILFLVATATLIWENHSHFYYRTELAGRLAGIGLIGWILWQSLHLGIQPPFQVHFFPLAAALAVALMASGFQGLLQYRRELAMMGFLGIAHPLSHLLDLSPQTAQFAVSLLRYQNFEAGQQGTLITLPMGTTRVYPENSGMGNMTYLLGIAVICLTLYPVAHPKKLLALGMALLIGFGVNGIKVAFEATLAAPQDQPAFLYWHEGEGALIFSIISILLFASFYWVLHQIECWQKRSRGEDA